MMEERSFLELYEATRNALWAYVFRAGGDKSLADDIVQEAYVRLLQSRAEMRDKHQSRAYLFRIATNLLNDHGRQIQKEKRALDTDPDQIAPDNEITAGRQSVQFETAYGQLSDQQRSLLWLAYVERYEHREIAAMLKLGEESVRVLLFRARRKLAEILTSKGVKPKSLP
jgi:RNA polymerase sigma-70 factor (ECF subfamily)